MKTLFIYNPYAGHVQIKSSLWAIIKELSSVYKDMNIYASQEPKDVYNYLKKNSEQYDLVIISGGDGTLSEAVNGIMANKLKSKIAYIPAGSTNDYASSLKLPSNMEKCVNLITHPQVDKQIDIGKFNNSYFVYIAAFGAFTEVAYSTPQDIKNVLGHLAYVLNGINSLKNIKSYKLKISINNEVLEDKFIYGMVTNTLSVGGTYKLDKKSVKLDDGLFEVLLIKNPKDLIELSEIAAFLIDQNQTTNLVKTYETNKLVIESNKEIPWTLDGEYGGSPKKVIIKNLNKALTLIK